LARATAHSSIQPAHLHCWQDTYRLTQGHHTAGNLLAHAAENYHSKLQKGFKELKSLLWRSLYTPQSQRTTQKEQRRGERGTKTRERKRRERKRRERKRQEQDEGKKGEGKEDGAAGRDKINSCQILLKAFWFSCRTRTLLTSRTLSSNSGSRYRQGRVARRAGCRLRNWRTTAGSP
jgi:hypothetical protein